MPNYGLVETIYGNFDNPRKKTDRSFTQDGKIYLRQDVDLPYECSVEDTVKAIWKCAEGIGMPSWHFDVEIEYGYYDSQTARVTCYVDGVREPTTVEREIFEAHREAMKKKAAVQAVRNKKAAEARDRKEFERLKKKFDKDRK